MAPRVKAVPKKPAAGAKKAAEPAAAAATAKKELKPTKATRPSRAKTPTTEKAPAVKPAAKPAPKAAPKAAAKVAAKAAPKDEPKPATNGVSKKRKVEDTEAESEAEAQTVAPPKKLKTAAAAPARAAAVKPKVDIKIGKKINDAPTQVLDVYVFGEGTSGELGLGSKRVNGKKPIDVKRPRLNDNLLAKTVGVVQLSCGGMHVVALTRDNKILTWGVNDQGALGRDTNWDGGLRDAKESEDSDSEDEDDDTGINPLESTPTAVSDDHFAPGTKFVQVVASDSASFVLTEDGRVYGWGTFRSSDGILGFTGNIRVQPTPLLLPTLKHITLLSAGANHILALDLKGNVVAWGSGQQNQLGRRIIERNKMSSLVPQGVGLPRGKVSKIACGPYHSFALSKEGKVWGWGLNNFGEIGSQSNAGEDDAVILRPVILTDLEDYKIIDIDGGVHHSLACSDKGDLFTWGRIDGCQVGFKADKLNKEDVIFDERGSPRILVTPTKHGGMCCAHRVQCETIQKKHSC